MWLTSPEHAELVRQWLEYHRLVGFDKFVIYDLDGSLAEVVAPFVRDGFVLYVPRWPDKLSPGACSSLHQATLPGRGEPPWARYCTQTQAEAHCVWSLRGRARWAMLLHSFDAYASSSGGMRGGVRALLRRLAPRWGRSAVLGVQRLDFGGHPIGSGAAPVRFRWRQRAPLFVRGARRGAADQRGAQPYDHPGTVLVNPANTWSMMTHWGRGRPGAVHLTLPPNLLRMNHYVDLLGAPRCLREPSPGGDQPCDVFDNSSAWIGDVMGGHGHSEAPALAPLTAEAPQAAAPGIGAGPGDWPIGGQELGGGERTAGPLLVVVPGHGRAARSGTLLGSLATVQAEPWPTGGQPRCLVFLYGSAQDFLESADVRELHAKRECTVERRPGGMFMEFLADPATAAALRRVRPEFVMLLLDDIALAHPDHPVQAVPLLDVMRRNRLDVASPALVGTHLSYDGMRPAHLRRPGAAGRLVSFIEWEAPVFTREAFEVLCRMVRPQLSRSWGYDELFPGAFRAEMGRAPRMGLIDSMHATHTGPWLASTTMREEEVYREEQALVSFYLRSFNISPEPIRMRRGYVF